MDTNSTEHPVSRALWQLALLPLTLMWAVVKGVFIGVIAVLTLGALS